jgi:hypothetical protein
MEYSSTEVEKLDLLTILTCVLKDKYKYAQRRNVEGIFFIFKSYHAKIMNYLVKNAAILVEMCNLIRIR